MAEINTAFVAYPSDDHALVSLIRDAVARANAKSRQVRFESWEFNDVAGTPLVSPILERIGESSFIVADVTYLNPNVVYEIGFSIGSKKRAFLVRHRDTEGDKSIRREAGIFDTLGYQEYEDADSLCHRLISHISVDPLPFNISIDLKSPVYVVEPLNRGDAATIMVSRLKKARYRYRSFNPAEDSRLSAVDAIRQTAVSAGVLTSLRSESTSDAVIDNIRALFVAGLAHGMGKPTLILSPSGYDAPLDVRDSVKVYKHPDDIAEHIHGLSLEITDHLQQADPVPLEAGTLLQSLRIGDPTAENEMTTLDSYYLRTDEYARAVRGEVAPLI